MQPNTITLPVDLLNNGTPTNEVFTRHSEELNKTVYRGPGHTVASPNIMALYRTLPKRSGNFLGTGKVSIRFTETVIVENAEGLETPVPNIVEVSFSNPVGVSAAIMKAHRQRALALLDLDAVMDTLQGILEI